MGLSISLRRADCADRGRGNKPSSPAQAVLRRKRLHAGVSDRALNFLLVFSEFLLKATEELVFPALGISEVVVREIPVGLFQFAFDDIPVSLE